MFPALAAASDAVKDCPEVVFDMNDLGQAEYYSMCGEAGHQKLIPDCDFFQSKGYAEARRVFSTSPIWQDRSDIPYWRGSLTGHRDGPTCLDMPRSRLCLLGKSLGYDCKITSLMQTEHAENARIYAAGINGPYESWRLLGHQRYNIDIDGNTSAWAGLFLKLLSGSIVLKVASPYRQWYYDSLVPWANFVPVASDLSDLAEVLDKLRTDTTMASEIGRRGRELALSLTYEAEILNLVADIEATVGSLNSAARHHSTI